jgi:hypothetical protein
MSVARTELMEKARLKVSDTFPLISFDDTTVLANDGQLINGEKSDGSQVLLSC